MQKLNRVPVQMSVVLILSLLSNASFAQIENSASAPLRLTMKRAVGMALASEKSYPLQIAAESVRSEEAHLTEARAALLPNIEGYITGQNQTLNLDAQGLRFAIPIPGFKIPQSSGQFSLYDARLQLTYDVLNLESARRRRAAREAVDSAKAEVQRSQDDVVAAVATAYLAALRAESLLKAIEADVQTAEEVVGVAMRKESSGTGTHLDLTRSRLRLGEAKQRRLAAESERAAARLELLRQIHAGLDTTIELVDEPLPVREQEPTLQEAIAASLNSRAELTRQKSREQGAVLLSESARAESYPSLQAFANYGPQTVGTNDPVLTHTAGFSLKIPIFDNGRRKSHLAASQIEARKEALRSRDLQIEVELQIRRSFESSRWAKEEAEIAEESAALAQDELSQTRRRYEAGLSSNLEVIEAQSEVARAAERETMALFRYRQAALDLWRAMGTVQAMLMQ